MNHIIMRAEQIQKPAWASSAASFCKKVLRKLSLDNCELSVVFCNNEFIRDLNMKFRDRDEPTDILSFSQEEADAFPEKGERVLEPVQYLETPWARKGLKRKSRRICISKSEELEQKARFLARSAKNAPEFQITNGSLNRLLGDMVISLDMLSANCRRFSVGEEEELKRLLIHGILHLSGRNHRNADPRQPMLILQEKILHELSEETLF